MIFDKIENFKNYAHLASGFNDVAKFIEKTDLSALPLGKTIISDRAFLNKQEYVAKERTDDTYESHLKYIDVQTLLSGEESNEFSLGKPQIDEINEKDVYFTNAKADLTLKLKANTFAVYFPDELHKPGIKTNDEKIVKIVFKVLAQ